MTSKAKTAEDWIPFLLTCMDYTPAKPDWKKIAEETGAYKSGKYVVQAYNNIRKKYNALSLVDGSAAAPPTPKSTKKRAAAETADEDDEEIEKRPKRARKTKASPKKANKKESMDGDTEVEIDLDATEDEGIDEMQD